MREYVLVSQKQRLVEMFRRESTGAWQSQEARAGQTLDLTSLEVTLAVDDIYFDPRAR